MSFLRTRRRYIRDLERSSELWILRLERDRLFRIGNKHARALKYNPVGVCGFCGGVFRGTGEGTRRHSTWHLETFRRMRTLTRSKWKRKK